MATQQVKLGHSFYIFTATPRPGSVPRCIVDCHGRPTVASPKFDLPANVEVKFYVSRGAFLIADQKQMQDGTWYVDAVDNIANDRVSHVDHVKAPMKCWDYLLSKQHKAHTGQKMYRYSHVSYDELKKYLERNPWVASKNDIITVRNRAGYANPTLSELIEQLTKDGYNYREIRCCFCRADFGGMIKDVFGKAKNELPGGTPWKG